MVRFAHWDSQARAGVTFVSSSSFPKGPLDPGDGCFDVRGALRVTASSCDVHSRYGGKALADNRYCEECFCLYNLASNASGGFDIQAFPAAGQAVSGLNRGIPGTPRRKGKIRPCCGLTPKQALSPSRRKEFLKRLAPAEYAGIKQLPPSDSNRRFLPAVVR